MPSALRQNEATHELWFLRYLNVWTLPEFGELWRGDESSSRPRILLMEKDNRWPETALEDSGRWVQLVDLLTGDSSNTQTGMTRVPIARIKKNY